LIVQCFEFVILLFYFIFVALCVSDFRNQIWNKLNLDLIISY